MIRLREAELLAVQRATSLFEVAKWGEVQFLREKTETHNWGWVFTFEGTSDAWQKQKEDHGPFRFVVESSHGLIESVGSIGRTMTISRLLADAEKRTRLLNQRRDGDSEQSRK